MAASPLPFIDGIEVSGMSSERTALAGSARQAKPAMKEVTPKANIVKRVASDMVTMGVTGSGIAYEVWV